MEKSKISWYYFYACDKIHDVIDDLYEALHEETGIPKERIGLVDEAMEGVKSAIYQELDLIKSIANECESEREDKV
tara:strand:+ start:3797 stop:4024 length:228 start_codon:yes stop_codon:yes gene_type:complete